jgi:hypothetical protein
VRHQAAIKRYFRQNIEDVRANTEGQYTASGRPTPKVDFDFVLSVSKSAFRLMRYLYEGLPPDTGWVADIILDGARHAILLKHPDWIRARQGSLVGKVIRVEPTSQAR